MVVTCGPMLYKYSSHDGSGNKWHVPPIPGIQACSLHMIPRKQACSLHRIPGINWQAHCSWLQVLRHVNCAWCEVFKRAHWTWYLETMPPHHKWFHVSRLAHWAGYQASGALVLLRSMSALWEQHGKQVNSNCKD